MKVTQVKSPVISSSDYYPFGAVSQSYSRENSVPNKRLYQGKEYQDDLSLNLYDFHWRQYDPWGVFTTTQDPRSEKFYNLSPYCWAGGNPLKFVDPDGREIIISGTAEFQKKTLAALQRLTSDKLAIGKNGSLVVTRASGDIKDKKYGTGLIRSLSGTGKNDHVHKISSAFSNGSSPTDKEGASTPGKGSGTKIGFNPNDKTGGYDVKGNAARPPEVGLAHELIHSGHANSGTIDNAKMPNATDPDTGKKGELDKEEVNTRKEENIIRKEQGVELRKIPN